MPIVVVGGVIANKYLNGGAVWTRLSWLLGFRKLGFQVYFIEQIRREDCVDEAGQVTAFEECVNRAYFRRIAAQFGFLDTAALIYEDGEQIDGFSLAQLEDLAETSDLLINISGHLEMESLLQRFRCKAYIDVDPGFTQFWSAVGNPGARLSGYDFYFTIGENIGKPFCPIPTGEIEWRPIRQPVVLEEWPVSEAGNPNRFTTIASWRGPYGSVEYEGKTFGLKVHEFRKFLSLPERSRQTFEIALSIYPGDRKDLDALQSHGWKVVDPKQVAGDPSAFRHYVQESGGEFSASQGIYVETESGWFSDRTLRYLASGKPALVQETGFSRNYPVGEGLVAFRTVEEALAGSNHISANYAQHCRSARSLAETYFDSNKVLSRLMEEIGLSV